MEYGAAKGAAVNARVSLLAVAIPVIRLHLGHLPILDSRTLLFSPGPSGTCSSVGSLTFAITHPPVGCLRTSRAAARPSARWRRFFRSAEMQTTVVDPESVCVTDVANVHRFNLQSGEARISARLSSPPLRTNKPHRLDSRPDRDRAPNTSTPTQYRRSSYEQDMDAREAHNPRL